MLELPSLRSPMLDLANIQTLLDTASRVKTSTTKEILRSISDMNAHVHTYLTRRVSQQSEQSPGFNILRITRRGNYEVTTHSALLAQLLNPLGTHEQGGLFLAGFLQQIVKKKPLWQFPEPDTRWLVQKEQDYIDIRLIHRSPQVHILIENKWRSKDRKLQVFDYWSQEHHRTNNKLSRIPIVYLTRVGELPQLPKSATSNRRRFMSDLVILSYKRDIRNFLSDTVPEVRSARVKDSLLQYRDLLEMDL